MAMLCVLAVLAWVNPARARQTTLSDNVKSYVRINAPIVALTNVRVIDGTGAQPRERQTLIIRDGVIAEIGDATRIASPAGVETLDLSGRTLIPGLVMVHEHLYYPTGPGVYGQLGESFTRLYLAGGVTTMRTGGNLNGYMDLNLKRAIEAGQKPGPSIDATAPYVNGPNTFQQMTAVKSADEAREHVAYWAGQGATSFKAYMQISRTALGATIDEAHKRGLKVTGHLCSVTYREAADLGIDNLEHGFVAATDFVADKQPDTCPAQGRGPQALMALDEHEPSFTGLLRKLIDKRVALTSTLTVFETLVPDRPLPPGLDVLIPQLRHQFDQALARASQNQDASFAKLLPKAMALERAFARAGGLLIAGTDPTGSGGVIPGFSNQRQIELLVEAGFAPIEAITIGTLNGARYLGREKRIGTLTPGKQADIVVLNGNPAASVADIRKVEIVFREGVGYDPAKLIESVTGRVGLF
jgi:imidazolonepropionase-like amidohydrolase